MGRFLLAEFDLKLVFWSRLRPWLRNVSKSDIIIRNLSSTGNREFTIHFCTFKSIRILCGKNTWQKFQTRMRKVLAEFFLVSGNSFRTGCGIFCAFCSERKFIIRRCARTYFGRSEETKVRLNIFGRTISSAPFSPRFTPSVFNLYY